MFGKRFRTATFGVIALLVGTGQVKAQESASHVVNVAIHPIAVIAVSGDPLPLLSDPVQIESTNFASDASSFYRLTSNVEDVVLEARLDEPLPEGTELWLTGGTTLGTSLGRVQLSAGIDNPIVSGISRGLENGPSLFYEWIVADGTGQISQQSRTVTLSLLNPENGARHQVTQTVTFGHGPPVASE